MKSYHFKERVNADGTLSLADLPPNKDVEIVVLSVDDRELQAEMKHWFSDIRERHPFAKMSKDDVLDLLRQNREGVWEQRHADQSGH